MNSKDIKIRLEGAKAMLDRTKAAARMRQGKVCKKIDELMKAGVNPIIIDKWDLRNSPQLYWTYCEYIEFRDSLAETRAAVDNYAEKVQRYEKLLVEEEHYTKLLLSCPKEIKQFFVDWAAQAYAATMQAFDQYQELKAELYTAQNAAENEAINTLDCYKGYRKNADSAGYVRPIQPLEDYLRERNLDNETILRKKAAASNKTILHLGTLDAAHRDLWLRTMIDKLRHEMLRDLFEQTYAITGEITSVHDLSIFGGDFNAYVVGKNGKASVKTIGAGNYRIQTYHFQIIVEDVKDLRI